MYFSQRGHDVALLDNGSKREWEAEVGGTPLFTTCSMEERARAWQEVTGKKLRPFKSDLREYDFVHEAQISRAFAGRITEFELLFCLGSNDDPNLPVIEKLAREFPARSIRILIGSSQKATNDKVSKLSCLASEAKYPWLVFSDSDIRVAPEYLRTVMRAFRDERVGAVTCLYLQTGEKSFANNLQTIGQVSDFYASLNVARLLDGVKFALGSTIAISKKVLNECGLFAAIENKPADDMLVGRMVSEKGYQVELLRYAVHAVADFESFRGFLAKRMRWAVIPVWDALAAVILLASFGRSRVRWRDGVYTIRNGTLAPAVPAATGDLSVPAEKKG